MTYPIWTNLGQIGPGLRNLGQKIHQLVLIWLPVRSAGGRTDVRDRTTSLLAGGGGGAPCGGGHRQPDSPRIEACPRRYLIDRDMREPGRAR